MHRRHQHINVPTEIVRTIAVIAETGSFSKAGQKLGLSQPAISAQVKRLQIMVGGPVFQKVKGGGLDFTPRGRLLLTHARKLLDANDQILSLGGAASDAQPVRLGLSPLYVEKFLGLYKQNGSPLSLHFHCDSSVELAKHLSEGFLDIACLLDIGDQRPDLLAAWNEDFVWARSRDFVLSPGMPIPLVSWPGSFADLPVIKALERGGLAYRMVFTSCDHHARLAAAGSGVGLIGLPAREVREPLMIAREYYLPPIGSVRAGIILRQGCDEASLGTLIAALRKLAPKEKAVVAVEEKPYRRDVRAPRRYGAALHADSDAP